jgi:hypothetical protein
MQFENKGHEHERQAVHVTSSRLAGIGDLDVAYVPRPYETIDFGLARLRVAVGNAVRAYGKTGRMLDAALTYAQFRLPVFPVSAATKKPIPKRDRDPTGKFPKGIPGTGGHKKATTDPKQILEWWTKHPTALIAMPMGPRNGVWCLDVDTPEDHADGVAGWNKLAAAHDPIVTREHRSATGGPHLIFAWNAKLPIGCSKGKLPKGISVKGEGGYILVPPSVRKRRAYTVFSDIDPSEAPAWLTDLILQGRAQSLRDNGGAAFGSSDVDLDELRDAMQYVPNDCLGWDDWFPYSLALFAATGGSEEGFQIFDEWSQKSDRYEDNPEKYGKDYTRTRWREIAGSPPSDTGVNKLFKIARENGWVRKPRETTPPATPHEVFDTGAARNEVRRIVQQFFQDVMIPESEKDVWSKLYYAQMDPEALVRGLCGTTGLSKTQITIEEMAVWLRTVQLDGPIIYAVPHHKLSNKIVELFTKHGIVARVFFGREHDDPERAVAGKPADEQVKMCLDLLAVNLAKKVHADINKTCCRDGKQVCRFHPTSASNERRCGYQLQQLEPEAVQVWITASDMLFHAQRAFGKPAAVIIDEGFWRKEFAASKKKITRFQSPA